MELTYLWLLWDKKSFGKEFIYLLALTSKILTNILQDRRFWHGEFIDDFAFWTPRLLLLILIIAVFIKVHQWKAGYMFYFIFHSYHYLLI